MGGRRCWAAPAGRVVVFVYLDDAALLACSVRRAGRQGDEWLFLLYIEGRRRALAQFGCICHRGEVLQCFRTDKLPAVFRGVFSRVTS